MFSKRVPADLRTNSLTELLRAKRAARAEILDLTESNPTRAGIVYPDGVLKGLSDPRALLYEPEPFGLPSAREAVSNLYDVPYDRVVMSASTSEAYSWLFKLLCDSGDEVLVPRPSYPLFEYLAALECVAIRHYSLFYDHGWFIDFHAVKQAISLRTKAIVLVNPNNPTGHFLRRHELAELTALCASRQIAILSDEVFQDYAIQPEPDAVRSLRGVEEALTFCLNGLSKTVGLPQLKLAWGFVSGPPAQVEQALGRLETISDAYLSAGTPVQLALPNLLWVRFAVQEQIVARLHFNLRALRSAGLRVLNVEAGWYAVVVLPGWKTEDEWVESLLVEHNVLVQPGYFYDFERAGYAVISLLTDPKILTQALHAVKSFGL